MAGPEVENARRYLAGQAAAGAGWWIAVFTSDRVRDATLGDLSPAWLVGPDLVLFVGGSALAARGSATWGWVTLAWTTAVTVGLWAYALATGGAGWGALAMTVAVVGTAAAALTLALGRLPTHWITVGPFAFRPAPERAPGSHLRHSLQQLVVFWVTFFVAVPLVLAAVERRIGLRWSALDGPVVRVAGIGLLVVFSGVGIWSCLSMALRGEGTPLPSATAQKLVVVGPYRFVRNPMAVAGLAQTTGVGLVLGAWTVIVIALAGAILWDALIRPQEEHDLAERFGPSFERYCAEVRCWVPRPPST
jgi:protein-S-isoprenylcysteine O-methyltransferase Ste14